MPSPREPVLPDGMKDLLDVIHRREQEAKEHREQLRQLKMIMERDCAVHPARIFAVLRQRIDQDLLFAEDFDLVRPRIREIVTEIWRGPLPGTSLYVYGRTRDTIIDVSVEIIREFISELRVRRLHDRDEGWRLEF